MKLLNFFVYLTKLRFIAEFFGIYGLPPRIDNYPNWRLKYPNTSPNLSRIDEHFAFFDEFHAFSLTDKSNKLNNWKLYRKALRFIPYGFSFQTGVHFIQLHSDPEPYCFRKYDFGRKRNLEK